MKGSSVIMMLLALALMVNIAYAAFASMYYIDIPPTLQNAGAVRVEIFYAVSGIVMPWEHTLGELYVTVPYGKVHLKSLPGGSRSVLVNIPLEYQQSGARFELEVESGHRRDLRITGHAFR